MAAQRPGTPQTLDGQVYWFDPEVKEDLLRRGMLNQINEFLHRMNAVHSKRGRERDGERGRACSC